MSVLLLCVIVAALIFDFTNGFHDAANAIGTSIATKALAPTPALILAGLFNFLGALLSTTIAATICSKIVQPEAVSLSMVFIGLVAAIAWNLATWYWGLPSSSSHCLIGGMAGAVAIGHGLAGVKWNGILMMVVIPTIISPLFGFFSGWLFTKAIGRAFYNSQPGKTQHRFRVFQLFSASIMALSHGLNDGQKTMGIITLALFAGGTISALVVPTWVKFVCAVVIGLGTLAGGKRIIRTLGTRIVKLTPTDGFCAQTAGALVLQATASLGLPISTTHVITATVMGVGASHRIKAVRWGVTKDILTAWLMTLPVAFILGAALALAFKLVPH